MKQNKLLTIQDKIDWLIRDMGKVTFLKLLHFVVDVMEADYQIKILMVRRCLDIFLEFEEIVEYLFHGTVKKTGIFVTNQSMVLFKNELMGTKVLVVDDIRLHGRALDELVSFLVNQCHCDEEDIVFKVFADNKDAVKVKSGFHNKIEITEVVNENRWRKISSSIVNSLYILGQPYISHLPYCEVQDDMKAAAAIKQFIKDNEVEEITTEVQNYYGVHVYLYFMDRDSDEELADRLPIVEQNIIRIYVYEKLGKIIIIPYAFLKPLNAGIIASYYEALNSLNIVQEMFVPKMEVSTGLIAQDGYWAKYLYGMEVYVSSLLVGKKFLANREIEDISWNNAIEKYNFGYHFEIKDDELDYVISQISILKKSGLISSCNANIQLEQRSGIEEIVVGIRESSMENLTAYAFMESYIKRSGRKDEELAEQGKGRMCGIEYLRLYQYFRKGDLKELWKAIVKIIDSGKGTLSVIINRVNQKMVVDSLLFAGEQNYTCNEPNLIYFVYPLLEVESTWQNMSPSDLEKQKGNLINKILNSFPELKGAVSREELEYMKSHSILKCEADYYMSRYPIYENDERLKKILIQTRCYKKG